MNVLELKGICKRFPGVVALDNVDFSLRKGEVHCLIGENGAGKSTLVKIIAGAYERDGGRIFFNGHEVEHLDVQKARELGVGEIYQELMLVPGLTVLENIFLGNEETGPAGQMRWQQMAEKTRDVMKTLGTDISPHTRVGSLSTAQQQMVEIARALVLEKEILVLDEPTDTLTRKNTEDLFRVIHGLKAKGVSIIYISHRLEEFQHIADRVTIMRDGRKIGTYEYSDITLDQLVNLMVGRDLETPPAVDLRHGAPILTVKNLTREPRVRNAGFTVHAGEIIGFSGLVGAGRTELMRLIFGADRADSGQIFFDGKEVRIKSPADAVKTGIGLLTEDRKGQGLVLGMSVRENITLASLGQFGTSLSLNKKKEKQEAVRKVSELQIHPADPERRTAFLSGGNQQKVVLGKWLTTDCRLLIFDEPTRGIDVGARAEIYAIMDELTKQGKAIIMVSSDLPEVLRISHRILVMCQGEITGELSRNEATEEKIMSLMLGGIHRAA